MGSKPFARACSPYTLPTKVTDPQNFWLCGLPPKDLWTDVAEAWTRAGFNVHDCFKRACAVTNEWVYDAAGCGPLKSRISQRISHERSIPLKNRTLAEVLNPQVGPFSSFLFWLFCATVCSFPPIPSINGRQPDASVVIARLLDWIDRVDAASSAGTVRPLFTTLSGEPIFPGEDQPWWLLSKGLQALRVRRCSFCGALSILIKRVLNRVRCPFEGNDFY